MRRLTELLTSPDLMDPNTPPTGPGPEPQGGPAPSWTPASSTSTSIVRSGPERSWEIGCHLAAFSGYLTGLGWILGPLIIWLLKKEEYPSVNAHGKEELNFQISVLIYQIALIALGFLTCGLTWFLTGVVAVAQLVLMIIASIKASEGVLYRYPLTLRLIG